MASRKEYEMLFALNARMNGGFSGTFSKAQAEFSRLGKEIQDLQRVQGNIASYQKQQSAIEATRSKLENLQKQHDLLQKEIGETNGSTAGLERESVKLEQRIKDTEAALERQGQKLDTTGAKLREAGVDTSNLAQKDVELTAKIKELQAEQEKAADSAERFGDQTAKALDAIASSEVTSAVVDGLGKIKDAFVECIDIAGNFEEAMSTVEALSGASAQEMAALAEEAKDLGATTKFTAKEAGDAMGYMAMAGWDASDMLQGMDGVLQLAAASGEDLAMVSDIVTDSLSAFGLTAKDTAHFSDVLAAAATSSNTNVAIMGETFKMSASVAGALGYSIEDVAVAMGLMANSGVKGSIAGTALRNTFNGLLEGVTLTGAAFGEYEYSAIKADGTMKDFGSTIDELRKYFDQMTEAERVNNAQAIAGQRGYNGLLAILNATDDDYASLTNSINNCTGAAQRMANVKLDNLNGQLTLMNSAWDALKTTIGEQFNPELRNLAEIGTDVLTWANSFVQEHPALVKGAMAAGAAFGGIALAITGVTAAMKLASVASGIFAGTMGVALGPVVAVTAAVAGVVGVVTALATAANEGVPSVKELTEAAREMGETMDEAADTYDKTVTATLAAAGVADTYITKLEEMGDYARLSKEEQEQYHNTLVLLTQVVPELASSIDLENNVIEGGTAALRANTEAWKENAMAQAYQDQLTAMYQSYSSVLIEAEENSIGLTRAQYELEAANQKYDDTIARMNELWAEATEEADRQYKEYGILSDATAFLSQEYYDLQNSLSDVGDEIYTAQKSVEAYQKAIDEDAEAVAAAEAEIELAEEAVRNLTGATEEQTEAESEAAAQAQELQGTIENVTERVAALTEAYNEAYGAALDSISGQYALWDEAAAVVETSAGTINSALESQITYWQDYNTNLQSLTERSADIEGLSDVIASFADGSQDSVNAIAGLANASDEDLRAMVTNWQTLQEEQEAAAGSVADLKTDFTSTMDELQNELAADIEAMDLGDEAAAAGQATIQGYINAANDMLPQVKTAYGNLAKAASSAMGYQSVYVPSSGTYVYQRGYASGTDNAAPGFALVGENGPELMFFNGGEKVLDASRTSALQARPEPALSAMIAAPGGGSSSVQVVFQIAGNATPDTVQALQDYGDDFAERVMEVVENAAADAARGAYR